MRAETPEATWTTVPPAKSSAPRSKRMPPPHTMCAMGEYTRSDQAMVKTTKAAKRLRSANAPLMSAGVMAANIIWNVAKSTKGMLPPG